MANNKITQIPNLTPSQASPNDLTVVVDVSDTSSPSGNTKNMTLGQLSTYLTSNQGLVSSSAQINLASGSGNTPVIKGGTGATYFSNGVLVGHGTSPVTALSGSIGQTLIQGSSGPQFIDNVVSSSVQISFPLISNLPSGLVSSSGQLTEGLFSSSAQVTFIGMKDTPSSYTPNAIVVSNANGTGLMFITGSEESLPIDQQVIGGRCFSNGTYYFNGDIRERIYANPNVSNLYSGSYSPFYENFIHSGNIYYDSVNENIYFVRGTWPRRQGSSSADLKGFTWREGNNTGLSKAEAICSTRDDGQNFQVIVDLYGSAIFGSQPNSVQDINGIHVVSEPSAVVFDPETNYLYFSCRNDHDASAIYRVTVTGSAQDIINSGVLWVKMASPNMKVDSLDLVTIPQNFYSVNSPSVNTKVLLFGVSPDYNAPINLTTNKNAALFMVPIDAAVGTFQTDYPQAYTLHKFWAASLDPSVPDMSKTGVKGIKAFIANINGGEWNPVLDDPSLVNPANSRIYVVSSGAVSNAAITNYLAIQPIIETTAILTTPASSVPSNPAGSAPIPGIATPTPGLSFTGPAIAPPPADIPGIFNNENFGGHAVLELLFGNVAGDNEGTDFSASDDANRQYKTWRSGILVKNGNTTELSLGFDDPSQPIGTPGSGPGVARGIGFVSNDRLYILTSPTLPTQFNSQVPLGAASCRGISKIINVNCNSDSSGVYTLENGDGNTGLTPVMVIPVLANTLDSDIMSMTDGSQQGLQQLAIDGINNMFYVADAFFSRYWSTVMNSVLTPGRTTTNPFPSNPVPNPSPAPPFNFSSVPGGSPVNYPPVPPAPSIPFATPGNSIPGNVVPGNQNFTPGNQNFIPPYHNPGNFNPPTPSGLYNPTNFNPANYNPTVYNYPGGVNPVIAGDTSGVPAVTTTNYNTIASEFGTIYEGSLFVYSRDLNGQRIFDNANPQIAYSRPTGLAGYNVGPANAFRLIYTNAENNFELLANNLGYGVNINGLSRTFVQDGVLAQGRNVASVSDAGPDVQGGIVITFNNPSDTSDYSLIAMSSNAQVLGTGQSHQGDPQTFMGTIDLSYPQGDGAYYYPKNRSSCRITYVSGSLPDVVYFACFEN